MIVLDASAVIEWLVQSRIGAAIEARIFSEATSLHAPHLLDIEIAQVLRKHVLQRRLARPSAESILQNLRSLSIRRHPHEVLLGRVWELRANLSCYDAVYVALAESLTAPLITCDRRLASAPGIRTRVEVF